MHAGVRSLSAAGGVRYEYCMQRGLMWSQDRVAVISGGGRSARGQVVVGVSELNAVSLSLRRAWWFWIVSRETGKSHMRLRGWVRACREPTL